jgi:hypothetical protein
MPYSTEATSAFQKKIRSGNTVVGGARWLAG